MEQFAAELPYLGGHVRDCQRLHLQGEQNRVAGLVADVGAHDEFDLAGRYCPGLPAHDPLFARLQTDGLGAVRWHLKALGRQHQRDVYLLGGSAIVVHHGGQLDPVAGCEDPRQEGAHDDLLLGEDVG